MFIWGLVLGGAALVCWAASHVMLIGFLFALPFPDLLIAAGALMVAGLLPLHRWVRILIAVMLWAGVSLVIELERLPQHRDGFGGVLAAESVFTAPVRFDRSVPLPVAGNASAFVSADGPAGFASLSNDMTPVRRLMANRAETVEPVDLLWHLGYHPALGAPGYPRLAFERRAAGEWVQLEVRAEAAAGQVAARFRRTYPVAPPFPGLHPTDFQLFTRGVLHDNLLRSVLGLNERVAVHRELSQFLRQVMGASALPDTGLGPLRALRVVEDLRKSVPDKISHSEFFSGLRSDVLRDPQTGRLAVCGMVVESREFGEPETRTLVSVLEDPAGGRAEVASFLTPGHAAFDHVCDPATGRLLTFMDVAEGAGLRVAGYERNGRLAEVHYFERPFKAPGGATVERGSLQRGTQGELSFAILMPIVILPVRGQLELEQQEFRRLALSGAPLK